MTVDDRLSLLKEVLDTPQALECLDKDWEALARRIVEPWEPIISWRDVRQASALGTRLVSGDW